MHRLLAIAGLTGLGLVCSRPGGAPAPVVPGIEVLLTDSLHLVQGKRVGLVSNQGGVDAHGVHEVDRLRARGVRLTALFSPEHGFRGTAAPGEAVETTRDPATGLPIYSLYGRTSAPTDSMLAAVDLLLVDLPDVGARYFTYLSTTIEVMRAAARRHIPVLVLDRPNPIGGAVQGNVLDTAYRSFVGMLALPMRHGLTLGELARLAAADLGIAVDLTVIPVRGWHRSEALDQTGLPFVPPSPNLRTLASLFDYPGLCLFEGTNLSVGRGSDAPFEQIGAPWLDTAAVLSRLRAAGIPGVRFSGVRFTPHAPGDGKFADTAVAGIRLEVTDRAAFDPTVTTLYLLEAVIRLHPGQFAWRSSHFLRLAGQGDLMARLDRGEPVAEIAADWTAGREDWVRRTGWVRMY